MKFTAAAEDPELLERASKLREANPYAIGFLQVLPSVAVNAIMGGLFFNSFVTKLETGLSSPLDAFPLLPALYFGVTAVQSLGRASLS